jgi:hypothetical protein
MQATKLKKSFLDVFCEMNNYMRRDLIISIYVVQYFLQH